MCAWAFYPARFMTATSMTSPAVAHFQSSQKLTHWVLGIARRRGLRKAKVAPAAGSRSAASHVVRRDIIHLGRPSAMNA